MNADLQAGIVRVIGPDGETVGTGFVVTDDGLIATCAHVVEDTGAGPGDTLRVAFHATGEERVAQVEPAWWRGPDAEDVAILRLNGPLPGGVTSLSLGSSADVGEHILSTFGFPDAKPVEGMPGRCEVVGRTTERGLPVLQLRSSEVTLGFSGAPVWDEDFHVVIGIVTSIVAQDQYGKQQETAFIIPVETLRAVCPALRLPEACPYRGLQVFEAEHADLYFGREAATRELLDILSRRDFMVLVGVSGSGKSSLVRAGLEKGLHEHVIPGLVERSRCLTAPGHNPFLNLALALADAKGITAADVTGAFDLPQDALAEGKRPQTAHVLNTRPPQTLADAVRACAPSEGLLLIVDQFERLYTECDDEAIRDRFVDALLAAAGDRVKVLLALRADYYGLALEHPGLEQAVKQGGQVTLGRMTEAELRAAIEEPAQAMGWSLQPGLAKRLVFDVHERAGDLPLLEFALTELWERDSQRGILTLATYEALGYEAPDGRCFPGVQGAIAWRAEAVWQGLDNQERRAARRVFLNLVTPGPLDERGERIADDASRRTWQAEWDETTRRVVRELVDARLVTTGQDPLSDQPTVEVAHEALIRAWPRLRQWIEDSRPFVRWYDAELAPFLRRWLNKEQQADFLLPEAMLAQSEHWLGQYPEELSGPPAEYIRASVEKCELEAAEQEAQRQREAISAATTALAHRMNNMVGTVPVRVEQIRELLEPGAPKYSKIERYLNAISEDIDDTLRAVKALTSPTSNIEALELVDIDVLVSAAIRRIAIPSDIAIFNKCDSDLPPVRVLSGQFVDTLENMIRNGIEAIDTSGSVTIKATRRDQEWIAIEIQDTGCGISPENLPKVFEMFSTTKPDGMGFALWQARTVIESLGGSISVDSKVGEGTTFTILLPPAEEM